MIDKKQLKNVSDDLEVIKLSLERQIREIQILRSDLMAMVKNEND